MAGRQKTPKKPTGKLKAKDPIEVYCRIRPLDNENETFCLKAVDDKTVALFSPDVSETTRPFKEVRYKFKHVYDQSTSQERLFKEICLPLVQDLLLGSSGLLFTYGVTSSGKTYTMSGNVQDGGLLPRSLDVIFNSLRDVQAKKYVFKPDNLNGFDIQSNAEALSDQQKDLGLYNRNKGKNKKELIVDWSSRVPDTHVVENLLPDMNFAVFISYVEIYNNYIYDLLDDVPIKNRSSKMLREDQLHNMYVFSVKEVEVKTVEEALDQFHKGLQRRRVSNTALNSESSRSHSVFIIRVVQAPLDTMGAEVVQEKEKMIVSQLALVDLAGSERPVRTKTTGTKMREAGNINSSLMALRKCIEALRNSQTQGATKIVPYRDSKLTLLFKTFFEGEGKIRMIVCVNPTADSYEETIHVMNFAEVAKEVVISRPTPVSTPTVVGFRAGRGAMFREAVKKAKEQGVPVSEVLPPTVYTLGSDFPSLMISSSDDESAYTNIIDYLSSRNARRNTLTSDLNSRLEDFRRNLMAVDNENIQLKQENTSLAMDLEARLEQVKSLENKLCTNEEIVDILQRQVDEYKAQAQSASSELMNKEREISNKMREMERMEIKWQEKYASGKDRLKRIMERRLAEKQAELERKVCLTGEKFRILREILNDDDWELFGDHNIPAPYIPSTTTSESSTPVTRPKFRPTLEPSAETRYTRTMSATDLTHGSNNQNAQFSNQYRNNDDFKENKPFNPSQGTKSIPVANPRHRKSASTGDVWIEHKPVGNLELATVLQPAIKKKKSVSKLEVKDVINSEKYMLQHQEQDSAGEVETQLYKGDVIPSAGGGAQVIFNDVEKLRQVSPPPVYNFRKRSVELPLKEIEDRCAVSVECHGQPTKIMRRN